MTREQWTQVKALFNEALNVPPQERDAWLARAAAGDLRILAEASALVQAHGRPGPFLEESAVMDPRDLVDPAAATPPEPVSLEAPLPAGSRIGDYEVRKEIGRGGMGVVYLARDVHLDRPAALKALPPALSSDATMVARMRREAQAAAAISHPGVAMVYAFIEAPEGTFIASEFIQGRTLRQEMSRGPFPPSRAVHVAIEIATALCAAHDAHVVHRDLKPDNVLLTASGGIKIIDFGIARMTVPGLPPPAVTRGLAGTPGYMAPEQLLHGATVDGRADLYALGVILAEMLAGRHPFERPSGITQEALLAVTRRCLESDPERRYPSARDLLRDLQHVSLALHDAGPLARRLPPRRRSPLWWWRFHQTAAAALAAVMTVPVWHARTVIGGATGPALFYVALAAIILAAILRLHLLFTSGFNPGDLPQQARLERAWILAADVLLALALIAGGVLVGDARVGLAIVLLAVGIGIAVVAGFVEPATTRAAFGRP